MSMQKLTEGPELRGSVKMLVHKAGTKELLFESENHNLIMQAGFTGLDLIIQWLIGQMATGQGAAAYVNGINYGEIGTGTATPTLTDTGNTTPSVRVIPSEQTDFGQMEAILQFYFPDASLTNATYTEFATFVNGSSGLSTGKVFNHALFGTPYAKSSGQDITVQVTFTLSQ